MGFIIDATTVRRRKVHALIMPRRSPAQVRAAIYSQPPGSVHLRSVANGVEISLVWGGGGLCQGLHTRSYCPLYGEKVHLWPRPSSRPSMASNLAR